MLSSSHPQHHQLWTIGSKGLRGSTLHLLLAQHDDAQRSAVWSSQSRNACQCTDEVLNTFFCCSLRIWTESSGMLCSDPREHALTQPLQLKSLASQWEKQWPHWKRPSRSALLLSSGLSGSCGSACRVRSCSLMSPLSAHMHLPASHALAQEIKCTLQVHPPLAWIP